MIDSSDDEDEEQKEARCAADVQLRKAFEQEEEEDDFDRFATGHIQPVTRRPCFLEDKPTGNTEVRQAGHQPSSHTCIHMHMRMHTYTHNNNNNCTPDQFFFSGNIFLYRNI